MREAMPEHEKEFVETKFKLKREIQKLSMQLSRLKDKAMDGNLTYDLYGRTLNYVYKIWDLLSNLNELVQEEEEESV